MVISGVSTVRGFIDSVNYSFARLNGIRDWSLWLTIEPGRGVSITWC